MVSQPHGGNVVALAAQLGLAGEDFLDFSVNVNPFGPPASVLDYCASNRPDPAVYPDPEASELKAAAAARHGVGPDSIIVGIGAAELLYWLCAYFKPRRAVVPEPAFGDYSRALRANGTQISPLRLEEQSGFTVDWAALEKAATGADMLVLGHPNNPTGRLLDREALVNVLADHPDLLVLVDEAFIDFSDDANSVTDAVGRFENLLVLRSLTKVYSIPNLRLGYLVGATARIRRMRQARPPWPLGEMQAEAGRLALEDTEFLRETRGRIAFLREALFQDLSNFSWLKPMVSDTNFLLVKILSRQVDDFKLLELLARLRVVVRACRSFPVLGDRFFRVAVRKQADNHTLVKALRQVEAEQKGWV